MKGSVGIFWGIPNIEHSWSILTDKSPLAEAESYGDFLTHPRGHYDVWEKWQQFGVATLARHGIPQAVAYYEYEEFPRGRIVYQVKKGQFIIYADRRLQRPEVLADIANYFGITAGTYLVRSDAHYRS